jgi:hypothetical protein
MKDGPRLMSASPQSILKLQAQSYPRSTRCRRRNKPTVVKFVTEHVISLTEESECLVILIEHIVDVEKQAENLID